MCARVLIEHKATTLGQCVVPLGWVMARLDEIERALATDRALAELARLKALYGEAATDSEGEAVAVEEVAPPVVLRKRRGRPRGKPVSGPVQVWGDWWWAQRGDLES